jgi:hypothetical protein
VIRTDADPITQPQIARGNRRLKSAPIARKSRISTAINTSFLAARRKLMADIVRRGFEAL